MLVQLPLERGGVRLTSKGKSEKQNFGTTTQWQNNVESNKHLKECNVHFSGVNEAFLSFYYMQLFR